MIFDWVVVDFWEDPITFITFRVSNEWWMDNDFFDEWNII